MGIPFSKAVPLGSGKWRKLAASSSLHHTSPVEEGTLHPEGFPLESAAATQGPKNKTDVTSTSERKKNCVFRAELCIDGLSGLAGLDHDLPGVICLSTLMAAHLKQPVCLNLCHWLVSKVHIPRKAAHSLVIRPD